MTKQCRMASKITQIGEQKPTSLIGLIKTLSISSAKVRTHIAPLLVLDWDLTVSLVSIKKPRLMSPPKSAVLQHPSGRPIRVICIDVGLKYNQLRCLLSRGVEVL